MKAVRLDPVPPLADYLAAMRLANAEPGKRMTDPMLLSWYDRDRDFESPQHAIECHFEVIRATSLSHGPGFRPGIDSAVPDYVDYALHRGASLMIDIERGRFVFFYLTADT